MHHRTVPSLALSFLLVTLSGCSGAPKLVAIDNALLTEVDAGDMERITVARDAQSVAEDALAKAKQLTKESTQAEKLARASLKTRRATLDQTKVAVAIAEDGGTAVEVRETELAHALALADAELARQELALAKRTLEHARLEERLALEEARLARARVELEKAVALQDVDRADARRIEAADYRKQVEYHSEEAVTARKRAEAARERVEKAAGKVARAREDVQRLTPAPVAPQS